jgi:hypothetical protein
MWYQLLDYLLTIFLLQSEAFGRVLCSINKSKCLMAIVVELTFPKSNYLSNYFIATFRDNWFLDLKVRT